MSAKRQALMDSVSDRDARREAMMGMMKSTDDKIEALLTPDQKDKYEAMMRQRMN
jgi:Spy/CpxP family protein refolding chaperone